MIDLLPALGGNGTYGAHPINHVLKAANHGGRLRQLSVTLLEKLSWVSCANNANLRETNGSSDSQILLQLFPFARVCDAHLSHLVLSLHIDTPESHPCQDFSFFLQHPPPSLFLCP